MIVNRHISMGSICAIMPFAILPIACTTKPEPKPDARISIPTGDLDNGNHVSNAKLHSDTHVSTYIIPKFGEKVANRDPRAEINLTVVETGDSRTRSDIFKDLGLDEDKISKYQCIRFNNVYSLTWQISPSFQIGMLTSLNDGSELPPSSPKRKVYGVCISKLPNENADN